MKSLPFISNEKLEEAVKYLIDVATLAKQKSINKFDRNVIDPFALLFEMVGFELNSSAWIHQEQSRQAQKTLQNAIGQFHQIVLGGAPGWKNHDKGEIDIESTDRKIIAEIKNKYNTVSGGKRSVHYYELENLVMKKASRYKGYTAYYVEIIPGSPKRYDKEFIASDKSKGKKCECNPYIRQIDGASFYALVTGVEDALAQLYDHLPTVIESICNDTNNYKFSDRDFVKKFFKNTYGE